MDLHSGLGILFLGVISFCLMTLTFLVFITTRQVRTTLLKIQGMLPACEETIHEARRTFGEARQLLHRTNETTQQVEDIVQKSCHGASLFLDNLSLLRERAQTFFKERFGNGSRPRPRRVNKE